MMRDDARRRGRFWPWFAVSLLAATAVAQGILLYAATNDDSFAVVPDYYRKAVAWDSTAALQRASDSLGWRATIGIDRPAGTPALEVRLVTATDEPVRGADVTAELIHNRDAARPVPVALREEAPGTYRAPARLARSGLWEVRVRAIAGQARFTTSARVELRP